MLCRSLTFRLADFRCCLDKVGSSRDRGVLAIPTAYTASTAVGLRVWLELGFCSLCCSCWHSSRAAPNLLMSKHAQTALPPRLRGMSSQSSCPLQPQCCFPPSQSVTETALR